MRVKIFSDSRFEEKTMPPIDNTRPPKLFPHDFAALSKDGSGTLRTDRTPVRERYEPAIHVSGSGFKGRVLNFFRSVAAAIGSLWKSQYSQDRAARAQAAYDSFKERLGFQVGPESAERILEQVRGTKKQGTSDSISGAQVAAALKRAHFEAETHNAVGVAQAMPGEYILHVGSVSLRTDQHHPDFIKDGPLHVKPAEMTRVQKQEAAWQNFMARAQKAGVKDLEAFSKLFGPADNRHPANAHALYYKMMTSAAWVDSRGQTSKLSDEEVERLANLGLKMMRDLRTPEQVAHVAEKHRAAVDQAKEILVRLAEGRGDDEKQTCMSAYRAAMSAYFKSLTALEPSTLEPVLQHTSEEGSFLVRTTLGQAMCELTQAQRDAIARLDINADYDKPNLPGFADESSATYALLGGLSLMNVNQYDRPRN